MAKIAFVQWESKARFGVMMLSAVLKKGGHACEVFIQTKSSNIIQDVLNYNPDVIAFSTMILSFTETTAFWIWAIILFTTRVGASAVNIMSESYFFKNVNDSNANIISFFRMTGPIAYTIAPLLASFLLLFIKFQFIFLILGLIMLFSLKYSLTLKDTK